ncbi:MAG: hypothetical protein SRB2_00318 [Desulfobacteraceae bacterium Eth-SRB2]|nr:MAG: hypothetical protein SRB2_00318 [Desulfobacteraceae bacterium Eth-SRB2]
MMNTAQLSEILTTHLELSISPVAVSLHPNHNLELEKYRPDKPLRSYCHGIMTAALGQTLYLLEKDIICKSGAATLGFSNYSEEMLSGSKHYNAGVFGSIQAAKNAVAGAYKLEDGSTSAIFLRPLSQADNNYQVILIPANAEQIMFILVADKYDTGGRTEISMATGFQGVCGDVTAYSIQTGKVNFSVTGFGDRLRCGLDPELMVVSIPAGRVSIIVKNLEAMSSKIMATYKKAWDAKTRKS